MIVKYIRKVYGGKFRKFFNMRPIINYITPVGQFRIQVVGENKWVAWELKKINMKRRGIRNLLKKLGHPMIISHGKTQWILSLKRGKRLYINGEPCKTMGDTVVLPELWISLGI